MINELNRMAVSLAKESWRYPDPPVIAMALETANEWPPTQRWIVIGADAPWAVVRPLCLRAADCEEHELLVEGTPILPEDYLRLWRNALQQATTMIELRQQGWSFLATLHVRQEALNTTLRLIIAEINSMITPPARKASGSGL